MPEVSLQAHAEEGKGIGGGNLLFPDKTTLRGL
jgi:hypothetical protein